MVTASADVVEALSVAIEAGIGVWYADHIADGLMEMMAVSRSYYTLYKQQDDLMRELVYDYSTGIIPALLRETKLENPQDPDYASRIGDMWGSDGIFPTPANTWYNSKKYKYLGNAYTFEGVYRQTADRTRLQSDWTNYMFRFEELNTTVDNDVMFQKKLQVMNLGLKVGSSVASSLQDSLGNYQEQMGRSVDQLSTFANGFAQYVGYNRGSNAAKDRLSDNSGFKERSPFDKLPSGNMWANQQTGMLV